MRIGLEFSKTGVAKYISHLDLQRAFSRAIRRSGLPVRMSQGFNPHYVMSFASALALGTESRCECVELAMKKDIAPDEFLRRIGKVLPPGLCAQDARRLFDKAPKMMAAMRAVEYTVAFSDAHLDKIKSAVCDIIASKEIFAEKRSKGAVKIIDIRPMILRLEMSGDTLEMRLASGSSGSLKPDLVIGEIKQRAGAFSCRTIRTRLLTSVGGEAKDLLAALSGSIESK